MTLKKKTPTLIADVGESTNERLKSVRKRAAIATIAFVALLLIAVIIAMVVVRDNGPKIYLEEVLEVPTEITANIEQDASVPGLYEYQTETETYVLITIGEYPNLVLNVTPNIDGESVYFAISTTEITLGEPRNVYRLYRTNATAFSTDETALKYPEYGVGTAGINIGWIEDEGDGEYFVTPLLDSAQLDRIFTAEPGVELSTGLYQYEYEVVNSGAIITSAQAMEQYRCLAEIYSVSETTADILTTEEDIRLSADISELTDEDAETINTAAQYKMSLIVTLSSHDGKLYIKDTDTLYQEGGETDEE